MPRYINKEVLYNKAANWEAKAMIQLDKLNKIPFGEMTQEEYIAWRVWSAVYQERTAFKHDVADAPTADVVEVVRCKDCKRSGLCEMEDRGRRYDDNFYCAEGDKDERR